MKIFTLIAFVFFSFILNAQNENLKLHYNFNDPLTGKVIQDISGNGYDAELKNDARADRMNEFGILNLGHSNGYLDMGEKLGELIATLEDFTVITCVLADPSANLNADGNFIWSFSNSDDILKDHNGCMFYSAKIQGYSITKSDYRAEEGLNINSPMKKRIWKHIAYAQKGSTATLYIDGVLVKQGSVSLLPKSLEKTTKNYIGRSPYKRDAFFKGLIADFRIYDKALTAKKIKSLIPDTESLNVAYEAHRLKPINYISEGNPLFTHKYTADPAALIWNNELFIYSGEDTGDGSGYNIPNWLVFSTKDLKNWTEYPVPLKCSDFDWATGNTSWASQVIERNGKFYWYTCSEHATIPGKAVGVAVADSPTGPYTDARGTALVTNDMTTKWTGISWDDIDPSVWIEDNGQAYLFWGNTQCYYAKLKDNMIELNGSVLPVELPDFTEAPWIHKRGDWYYLSYASGFPEKTVYAMSKSIHGPWEYKGILNEFAGNSNTNHQAIVEFRGKWYFVYHNGGIQPSGGSYNRSVCMDYLHYNNDSTLKRVKMTTEGVIKIEDFENSVHGK